MKTKLNQPLLSLLLPLVFFLLPLGLFAQDFHLSQFDAAPQYFNPALTGIYFGTLSDYRVNSVYRSQWKSLGVKPFSTFFLSYDMPYKQYGLGACLVHNRNGTGGLNSINFMPSASYKITNEINGPHNLSVGAQAGIFYRSFDPGNYTYNNQFSVTAPGGFDPTIPSKEAVEKNSILKFDANMGVFYKFKKTEWKAHPFFGYSVYHITRPNQSFTGITKDKIPMRWVLQGGADYKISEEINIMPAILYMNQGKAYELNIGCTGFYNLKDTKYDVMGGLNYRLKDAFIIQVGMKYDQHIFRFSYDINTSSLNNYTNGKGAFEFSVLLSGLKGKPMFNPRFGRGKSINKKL